MRQAVGLRVALAGVAIGMGWPDGAAWAQRARAGASASGSGQGAAYKPVPLNLQKEQLGGAELPELGRSRMRSGDYDGALQAFDAALRTQNDPAVHRDRGLCHEQLGHVYPAIDDYRVYLTERPEAPDADGIARRLRTLEDQVAGRAPTASTNDDDTPAGMRAEATVRVGHAAAGASAGEAQGATASDKLEYREPDEDAARTPLRRGKGFTLAPFFSEHKWISGSAFEGASDGQTWAEAVGVQVRYALGPKSALVAEIGYEYFNTTSVDLVTVSGMTSLVGYELRFPLDPGYDDQVLVVPELGYEHLNVSSTGSLAASQSIGGFVPRLRVGWRHMVAAATALDLSLDAGAGSFFTYDKFPFDSTQTASEIVTGNLSIAWGL